MDGRDAQKMSGGGAGAAGGAGLVVGGGPSDAPSMASSTTSTPPALATSSLLAKPPTSATSTTTNTTATAPLATSLPPPTAEPIPPQTRASSLASVDQGVAVGAGGRSTKTPVSTIGSGSAARASSAAPTAATSKKPFQAKRANSATNSPLTSRETSPVRPLYKIAARTHARSRQNSIQDDSASRPAAGSVPSAPSVAAPPAKALSTSTTPTLAPVATEAPLKAPAPQKLVMTAGATSSEDKNSPRWPVSPRLRSPPPLLNKPGPTLMSPRKADADVPTRLTQSPELAEGGSSTGTSMTLDRGRESESDDAISLPSGMRTPARGVSGTSSMLETVPEISQPGTPMLDLDGAFDKMQLKAEDVDDGSRTIRKKSSAALESGEEPDKTEKAKAAPPTAAASSNNRATVPTKKAFSVGGTSSIRGKPASEGLTPTMTVETETVSSIPQVAVGGGASQANIGSLRAKPSTETIRPKKEKKRTTRKPPSVTSGTGEPSALTRVPSRNPRQHHLQSARASYRDDCLQSPPDSYTQGSYMQSRFYAASPERMDHPTSRRPSVILINVSNLLTRTSTASSKADIFEAKVASAVDEANSSDSEETFVYESNPPEADRPRRYHSRTPSVTSMASQVDLRNGARVMDGAHSVALKKSMKFANSYASNAPTPDAEDESGKSTIRSSAGTGRGTGHHHHGSRWGRGAGGNGHASLFDNESPFQQPAKSAKFTSRDPRHSSRPSSPRIPNMKMTHGLGVPGGVHGKRTSPIATAYDLDDGADDERTPLMSSTRSNRSTRARRPHSSMRQLEHAARRERGLISRFGGCLVLLLMFLLVISGGTLFLFSTSQPLTDVRVLALRNILASEQDVIFDLKVTARNPNLVAVTIDTMDIVVFAKSRYAGTDEEWWRGPPARHHGEFGDWHSNVEAETGSFPRSSRAKQRLGDRQFAPITGTHPSSSPNLEIGHVFTFSSPLIFEGSPFSSAHTVTIGEVRIDRPGNATVPRGSERWGRVLQHEFELIVRGTLRYSLPLGQKVRSVSIEGKALVGGNASGGEQNGHGDVAHVTELSEEACEDATC